MDGTAEEHLRIGALEDAEDAGKQFLCYFFTVQMLLNTHTPRKHPRAPH